MQYSIKHWENIGGIVHIHSTYGTAWAKTLQPSPVYGTTHADHTTAAIPCAPPMSDEKIKGNYEYQTGFQIINHLKTHELDYTEVEMILVGNHAPFTCGKTAEIVFKPTVKTKEEIYAICQEANHAENCIGIIAWMHTFSPAKMWISGLMILQKPLLYLDTQFNRDIPWSIMDMDFMNLNQSAHGDREFGFIVSRMRINRKVVAGHWEDPEVRESVNTWLRAAAEWFDLQGAKFVSFGDTYVM